MEIDHRQGRELQRAREIRTNHPYQTVPYDIVKASQAIFLAELLFKVLKEEEARPKLFQFLSHSFQIFDLLQHGEANFHFAFDPAHPLHGICPYRQFFLKKGNFSTWFQGFC